jgi:hypothetical protein
VPELISFPRHGISFAFLFVVAYSKDQAALWKNFRQNPVGGKYPERSTFDDFDIYHLGSEYIDLY